MANDDIRQAIENSCALHWEVAAKIGVTETTFSRWLRLELPPEKKQEIFKAIKQVEDTKDEQDEKIEIDGTSETESLANAALWIYRILKRSRPVSSYEAYSALEQLKKMIHFFENIEDASDDVSIQSYNDSYDTFNTLYDCDFAQDNDICAIVDTLISRTREF